MSQNPDFQLSVLNVYSKMMLVDIFPSILDSLLKYHKFSHSPIYNTTKLKVQSTCILSMLGSISVRIELLSNHQQTMSNMTTFKSKSKRYNLA